MAAETDTQVHGTAVAVDGRAVLITGDAASGKSTLALEMIALGAGLVADDRVDLRRDGGRLVASAPDTIAGLIEATGAGLIRLPHLAEAQLVLAADMDQTELRRLPGPRKRDLLGVELPVILARGRPGMAAILVAALRHELLEVR